jgi:hypothetical protein
MFFIAVGCLPFHIQSFEMLSDERTNNIILLDKKYRKHYRKFIDNFETFNLMYELILFK